MAEQEHALMPADMDRELTGLAPRVAFPPTPDMAATVRHRLGPSPAAAPARRPSLRRIATLAAVVAVLAVLVVVAVVPATRRAVAERLGLRGVEIRQEQRTSLPTTPTPSDDALRLFLGEPVTLDEARAWASYPLALPSDPALGPPDEVYRRPAAPGNPVTLLWRARPDLPAAPQTGVGLLITQFRATLDPVLLKKTLTATTRVEFTTVNRAPAYWLEGGPHLLIFRAADGDARDDRTRLAANTLLWEENGVLYRLEGALSLDQALRIARSMR